ncbi:3',5'-cyclic adenosine monophosphate phosphodiesterase CpdA [Roseovarius albus]|uniref:3',5'-cyclic adenosine monophosphate phosphodiesterase CpdA n=1 Tax=Roseovarius albus TaxID=1247867 RepID=A0A1X6ZGF0_9RHOB|nr:phosphodiesterase [Roseovarius albus]SLN50983.1 3',5'-cyclic adenosine monophosphate phosphodiesterase CpdA [Roseovarius albus]
MSAKLSTRILWLSDLHFDLQNLVLGHDPIARLNAAIEFITQHYADAALCMITGDMVETATVENYTAVRTALDALPMPWLPMAGNHDKRTLFLQYMPLPDSAQSGFAQYTVDLPNLRLICLDSLKTGADSGELCAERLRWLKGILERTDTPCAVALHHPPVPLDLPMLDPDRLEDSENLMQILAQYPMVKHVFCGHVHRPVTGCFNGLPYTSIRSVLYQAPPPMPAWDWDSFNPAPEAPDLGVIDIRSEGLNIQFTPFCSADHCVTPATT